MPGEYFSQITSWDGILNDPAYLGAFKNIRWRSIYPSPYFDPICMQIISDPKILIRWSRFFYEWHPIVHAAVNKMAAYPITDFVFDTADSSVRKNYEAAFDTLNVRSILIKAGIDYYVNGNSLISTLMPFKRFIKCNKCNNSVSIDNAELKTTSKGFQYTCGHCNAKSEPQFEDMPTHDIRNMRVIHWNPLSMTIEHDPVMSTSVYEYSIPSEVKEGILKGDKQYLSSYPKYMMDAARHDKMLKIYSDKIVHIKRETHSAGYYPGWGQPLITPVMKYLFHQLVLLKAQDALAIDQILPWTIMSPAPNSGTDPATDMDMSGWAEHVKNEYEAYKMDPTRKSIMPVPMNAQIIGAHGKGLMVLPEISELNNQILAGMCVPSEFVFGGLTWSGASVSLRMLENQFIGHRLLMQRVIDDIVDNIHNYFGYPRIHVKMQNFKMADDVAQKEIIMQLKNMNLISARTLLAELMPSVDYEKEQEDLRDEQLRQLKLDNEMQTTAVNNNIIPQQQQQHGDLPDQNPPRSEGGNQQI